MSNTDEVIENLQADLEVAYERIAELQNARGSDEFRSRADAAETRVSRLEDEAIRLTRENETLKDKVETLSDAQLNLERALREERAHREDAAEALMRMKTKFESAEDQLAKERQRAAEAAALGARAVKDKHSNSAELEKYAVENNELREEIKLLNEDILAYREAVAELKGDLEDAADDKAHLDASLRDANIRIADLMRELEEMKAGSTLTTKALEEKGEEARLYAQQVEEAVSRGAADTRKATERALTAERTIAALQVEMRTIKDQTRVKELEDSITFLNTQVTDLTSQRDELALLLDAHNAQLEAYMRDIHELEEGRSAAIDEALRAERKRAEHTVRDATNAGEMVKEERARTQEMLVQKAEVERELEDARARLTTYERGYGLEDAIREQERLREAVRRRDADIARLTRTAGGQLDAYDILMEISRRLVEKAGFPRTADVFKLYPELELRTSIETNSERLRSMNLELQRQNDALEEQRTKLLRQLRVHAEQLGGSSLKYFGLSAEQLMLVNEFAENLRDGKVELPVNDRTAELQGEVRRLRSALEDAKNGNGGSSAIVPSSSSSSSSTSSSNASSSSSSSTNPTISAASVAEQVVDATSREMQRQHASMRDTLREVADENRRLREQVENVLGDATRRAASGSLFRTMGSDTAAATSTAATIAAITAAAATRPSGTATSSASNNNENDVPHLAEMLKDLTNLVNTKLSAGVHLNTEDLEHILHGVNHISTTHDVNLQEEEGTATTSSASSGSSGSSSSQQAHPVTVRKSLRDALSLLQPKVQSGSSAHPDEMQDMLESLKAATQMVQQLRDADVFAASSRATSDVLAAQLHESRAMTEALRQQLASAREEIISARAAAMASNAAPSSSAAAKTPMKSNNIAQHHQGTHDGDFGPRSPAGKSMIRRSGPDGAPMPVEEWAAEVTDARSALVEALEELAVREDEVARLEQASREHSSHLSTMMAQQTSLYREYIAEKAKWESELHAAQDREMSAVERADLVAAKAARLDQLTAVLEGGADVDSIDAAEALTFVAATGNNDNEMNLATNNNKEAIISRLRNYVKVLARKLAALEVAQPILARKYNVLKQETAGARAGQRTAELSAVEAEAHLRHRILYLELWKKGAESRLSRFTEMMETWVPGEEQASLVIRLNDLQARHTDLLAAEGELRIQYTRLRELPHTLSMEKTRAASLQVEVDTTRAALAAAQTEAANARAALQAITSSSSTTTSMEGSSVGSSSSSSSSSFALLQTASRGELIAAVTKQQASMNEIEIQLAALQKKNSIASTRVAELEGAFTALQQRATASEDALVEAKAQVSRASSEKADALAKLVLTTGGGASSNSSGGLVGSNGASITAADIADVRTQIRTLKDERDVLARELYKAREIADIASDQAAAVTGITKDHESEKEELREQLRVLTGRSDDDAIIGVLQHQLLSLKGSFHSFLRKHDGMRTALQRTRMASTALEVVLDQRAGEVLAIREDGRVKQLALQRIVDEMRGQVRALEHGGLSLAQATAFNDSVRRLSASVDRQALELEEAMKARHAAEEQAEAKSLELASLQRTLEDLRAATGSSAESRDVVRRLIDLNDQLKAGQLTSLRSRRELALLRDEARLARKRMEDYEVTVRGLEERIVAQDTDQRRREDEYRRQLRAAVAQAKVDANEAETIANGVVKNAAADVHAATSSSSSSGTTTTSTGPAGDLESTIVSQRIALDKADKELRESRTRAEGAVERARMRKRRIDFLERQLELHGVDIADLRTNEDDDDMQSMHDGGVGANDDDDDQGDENSAKPTKANGGRIRPKKSSSSTAADAEAEAEWRQERAKFKEDASSGLAKMREHYEEEAKRLQKAAQATTASLKELITKKNVVIKEYQDKFESLRRERDAERARELGERERIAQAAYEENRVTIERLRAALKDVHSAPESMSSLSIIQQQLADRAEALERAVSERDRRIEELQLSLHAATGSLTNIEGRAAESGVTTEAVTAENAKLVRRVQDAEKALKEGLATRDRKLKALQLSFAALKKEFVEAEEAHAGALMAAKSAGMMQQHHHRATSGGSGAEAAANTTTSAGPLDMSVSGIAGVEAAGMRDRVSALVEQVGRMGKEVKLIKAREMETSEERDSLQRDLNTTRAQLESYKDTAAAAETSAARLRAELSRCRQELADAKLEAHHRLAEAVAHGARMGADGMLTSSRMNNTTEDGAAGDSMAMMKRIKILEAQNAALRSAQAEAANANGQLGSSSALASMDSSQLQAMINAAAAAQAKAAVATTLGALPPTVPSSSSNNSASGMFMDMNGGGMSSSFRGSMTAGNVGNNNNNNAATSATGAVSDARIAWEEQRKLRKKLESVQSKFNEKVQEAEAARQSETATATALAKTKSERDALEKRLNALIKKQQNLDAATVAALNEIEPVVALKARVFELEEELSQALERADGELAGEIRRLKAEVEGEKLKATALTTEAIDCRERLRALQKLVGSVGGPTTSAEGEGGVGFSATSLSAVATARLEEDRYLAEASLRDKIAEARRQIASLEGALLSKDSIVMELQFELESARQAADRLRKRIAEVTAFATIATRGKPLSEAAGAAGGSNLANMLLHDPSAQHRNGGKGDGGGAGGRNAGPTRREGELEDVIAALKRVTDKQKAEIERLRKQVESAGQAKAIAAAAAAANATANAMAVAEHTAREKETAASASKALQASSTNTNANTAVELAEATRSLKSAKQEIKALQDRITALSTNAPADQKATDSLRVRLAAAEGEARRLDTELKSMSKAYTEKQAEVESLRKRAKVSEEREAAMEKKLKETGNASAIPPALPPAPAPVPVVTAVPAAAAATTATNAPAGGASSTSVLAPQSTNVASGSTAPSQARKGSTASIIAATTTAVPGGGGGGTTALVGMAAADAAAKRGDSNALVTNNPTSTPSAMVVPSSNTVSGGGGTDLSSASPDQLRSRVTALEKENADLRGELSAFDLDFFEEIEDLKYKYAEAAKKCRAFDEYVRAYPPTRG